MKNEAMCLVCHQNGANCELLDYILERILKITGHFILCRGYAEGSINIEQVFEKQPDSTMFPIN